MKPKKPFKETALGSWLTKNVPVALDVIGEVYPPVGRIRDIVRGHGQVTAEQQLEMDKLLMEYDKELLAAEVADLDSARKMQVAALQQEDPVAKRFVYILGSATFVVVSGFGAALMFVDIPEKNQRLVEMFFDIAAYSALGQVYNFFFGSAHTRTAKQKPQ